MRIVRRKLWTAGTVAILTGALLFGWLATPGNAPRAERNQPPSSQSEPAAPKTEPVVADAPAVANVEPEANPLPEVLQAGEVLAVREDAPSESQPYNRRSLLKIEGKYPLVILEEQVLYKFDAAIEADAGEAPPAVDDGGMPPAAGNGQPRIAGKPPRHERIAWRAMAADHVVVRLRKGTDRKALEEICASHEAEILRPLRGIDGAYLVSVEKPTLDAVHETIAALQADAKSVAYAEPDWWVHISGESVQATPNDPDLSKLWGLHNTGQVTPNYTTGGTVDADIDAPEAWSLSVGSRSIIVGVIDTGVDYNHPDLSANMWKNPGEIAGNNKDDDNNGFVDDVYGYDFYADDGDPMDDHFHGTHCAGTIGAVGGNSVGITGVCQRVSLMALRFMGPTGSGYTSDGQEAIAYATAMGAHLTSNSWGGGGFSQLLQDTILDAHAQGRLFVAAAGNSGSNNDETPQYPSNCESPNVLAIGASDHDDKLANFSCYGLLTVDVCAPGVQVYSTFPTFQTSEMKSRGLPVNYATISGTSMATPHAAGACALLWSYRPGASSDTIRRSILQGAEPKASLAGTCATGARLNVRNAISKLDNTAPWPYLSGTVVDDDATAPSSGNNRGDANPGETIELAVTLTNGGASGLAGANAVLTSSDSHLTITSGSASLGDISVGGSKTANFVIKVAADYPKPSSGFIATAQTSLKLTDNTGRSWTISVPLRVYFLWRSSGLVRLDGAPLPAAWVVCYDRLNGLVQWMQTGADGKYGFYNAANTVLAIGTWYPGGISPYAALTNPTDLKNRDGLTVNFDYTSAVLSGIVRNGSDAPLQGATVEYDASCDYFGWATTSIPEYANPWEQQDNCWASSKVVTGSDGKYRLPLVLGRKVEVRLQASKSGLASQTVAFSAWPGRTTDFKLGTPAATVTPASLSVTAQPGQKVTKSIVIKNSGTGTLDYSVWKHVNTTQMWQTEKTITVPAVSSTQPYIGYRLRDGGQYYYADGEDSTGKFGVCKLNKSDLKCVAFFPFEKTIDGVCFDGTNLWVTQYGIMGESYDNYVQDIRLCKVSPSTGAILATFRLPRRLQSLHWHDGYLYSHAVRWQQYTTSGLVNYEKDVVEVYKIDPATGEIVDVLWRPCTISPYDSHHTVYGGTIWNGGWLAKLRQYKGAAVREQFHTNLQKWQPLSTPPLSDADGFHALEAISDTQLAIGKPEWVSAKGTYDLRQLSIVKSGVVSWLGTPVAKSTGTISQSASTTLNVTLDASQLSNGVYTTKLFVSTNNPSKPVVEVPVTLTVGNVNQPPVFDSEPWVTPNPVTLPNTATASVVAFDPDGAQQNLVYTWSKVSGPGTVTFTPNGSNAADTSVVEFSAAGTYVLRAKASDGAASCTGDVTVVVKAAPVNQPPAVSFVTPTNGLSLPAPADLGVTVSASDSDGSVAYVDLFINGTLVRREYSAPYDWGTANSGNTDQPLLSLPAGQYVLQAVAADNSGATKSVSVTVTVTADSVVPGGGLIVDNRDTNTSSSGTWKTSTGANPYATDSIYSDSGGTFRWTPTLPTSGLYQVYAWWTYHDNRSTTVPYRIAHVNGTSKVVVNQHDQALAGKWVLLGTYSFNAGTSGTVSVSSENGQACADAVKFVPLVVDNRDIDTSATGEWKTSGGANPYGEDSLYSNSGGTFRWTPTLPTSGLYEVYAWWTYWQNRSTTVPYRIGHADGTSTVLVDQHDPALGGKWVLLGTYSFDAGTSGTVTVSSENGQACADAVKFVPLTIVDNRDSDATATGDWKTSGGADPYAADSLYSNSDGIFRWTATPPTSGLHEVYAWWTYWQNRSTTVPYRIEHANGTSTVTVNQHDQALGGKWVLLGTYSFDASAAAAVTVSSENGQACADAVKFVPVSGAAAAASGATAAADAAP